MDCLICKQGKTQLGTTTITLERAETTVVFKNVPVQVCGNCGEPYVDEETSGKLLEAAEQAASSGVLVDVREYTTAMV
ncbi:MAG: type II toxin-antitoxin system MqsA family antitoxin [Acidobacteria bacterium]|nr:type II toxin-antitoxin system MqsA family antitoxin [Acidobacteriota bacterium]